MDWILMSDVAVLEELSNRLKAYRLQKGFTQKDLAEQVGVSIFTIAQMEKGKAISLVTFVAVLRAFRLLANLDVLLPKPTLSPVKILESKQQVKVQQRVKKKNTDL